MENNVFEKLSKINVNGKTEKKGMFTYLSWSFAWEELKKVAPDSFTTVYHDENTNMPYFLSKAGAIVKVGVTVNGLEHISYLPVMDFKNKAVNPEQLEMMGINKAIQRCTVKAIALHGLGLYIYAGEDLPIKTDEDYKVELKECSSKDEVKAFYNKLPKDKQTALKSLVTEFALKLEK